MLNRVLVCSAALYAAVILANPARADEIFSCEGGTLLYVNSENRRQMYEHPCVKAWFAMNSARQLARSSASPDRGAAASPLPPRSLSRSAQWLVYSTRDRQKHPTPASAFIYTSTTRPAVAVAPLPRREAAAQPPRTHKIRFRIRRR
ncbi:MAG: hypothetical protein F9K29_08250 [Hyphomicrobiaceae bacterium]|nr:MAG: hypothetical protein F9K29_08250 [Hyphomicrobiaceae bacterium]